MNIRVTSHTQTTNSIAYMRERGADLAKYQDQISSGLRVTKPSDDPGLFPTLSLAKAAAQRLDSYSQTVGDSTAVLNAGVSALQDVNAVLVRAKQIALEGADSATGGDPGSRETLATELDGLIQRALATANQRPEGKSLFAGTATGTPPFRVASTDAAGRPATIAYDGAADRTRTLIARGQTVDTRYAGSAVFQRPGADVFQSLIALRDDLRNPALGDAGRSQALNQRLTEVDAARVALSDATGEQASNLATLDALQNLMGNAKVDAKARVGDLESTDYAEAIVRMQEQESALQSIYAVSARMFQPGLLDFIR